MDQVNGEDLPGRAERAGAAGGVAEGGDVIPSVGRRTAAAAAVERRSGGAGSKTLGRRTRQGGVRDAGWSLEWDAHRGEFRERGRGWW